MKTKANALVWIYLYLVKGKQLCGSGKCGYPVCKLLKHFKIHVHLGIVRAKGQI